MRPLFLAVSALALLCFTPPPAVAQKPAEDRIDFLLGKATKLPTEYTNQESTYFSIIGGLNDRVYVGTAKYGVNAYLLEFDPKSGAVKMVMDVHKEIGSKAAGFAAQAKIHTRCNVGASGKIYVGTKQGYPEKGETVTDYLGGYVLTYDPKTGKTEHFGIAKKHHGIISVTPDEKRGVAYVSTCSDGRPIDSTHFMVLDLKTKKYTDLGDMEQSYAFIVLDDKGRAYHPKRGGTIVRYDPETKKAENLAITIDGKPADKPFTNNGDRCILNWDWSPDHKTLWCVEMSTNALYQFDLTARGSTLPGKTIGTLLLESGKPRRTDCRAMCVGPDGRVWAAVTEHGGKVSPLLHLVSYKPGDKSCRDRGVVGLENADFTRFTDEKGKEKPWHHTMPMRNGVRSPWQPMGVCAMPDGSVYVLTIAPFTLIRYTKDQVK